MRFPIYLLFAACIVLFSGNSVLGQTTHFHCKANTGNNAIVGIPSSIKPTVCGNTIAIGDEIGVFTPKGLCVGAGVWTGSNMTITVWGDDDQPTGVDGIRPGEQLQYRVHRKSDNREYIAYVKDSLGINTYIKNWIYHLRALIGTSQLSVKVKVFLEGPYCNGEMKTALNTSGVIPLNSNIAYNTMTYGYTAKTVSAIPNTNIVDWVLVELRIGTSAWTKVESQAGFLLKNGSVVDVDGSSDIVFTFAPAGNYYIVIRHRNHLAVMSHAPVPLPNSTVFDFTTSAQAFGSVTPMKLVSTGEYTMWSGDTDSNGTIDANDRANTWNNRNISGYLGSDTDLNGVVDATDRANTWNNKNISTQVPR